MIEPDPKMNKTQIADFSYSSKNFPSNLNSIYWRSFFGGRGELSQSRKEKKTESEIHVNLFFASSSWDFSSLSMSLRVIITCSSFFIYHRRLPLIDLSSTSKTRVESGGICPGKPRAP